MININNWSRIGEDDFKSMQFDSGMIVKNFNPASTTPPVTSDILCTTSGDITVTCTPELVDLGDDVNNLHGQYKELVYISKYTVQLGFTALNMTPAVLKLALGSAGITSETGKVTPTFEIDTANDFQDITWIGRRIDGGLIAATIKNAYSTSGLSLSASKDGKGNTSVTLTGFMTMSAQGEVPIDFYSIAASGNTMTAITVTSAAGTTSGMTKITMTGFTPSSGDAYVYKTASGSAPSLNYGETPDYTWTAWDGSADIAATNGHKIAIAAVSSTGQTKAYGSATVIANTGA